MRAAGRRASALLRALAQLGDGQRRAGETGDGRLPRPEDVGEGDVRLAVPAGDLAERSLDAVGDLPRRGAGERRRDDAIRQHGRRGGRGVGQAEEVRPSVSST